MYRAAKSFWKKQDTLERKMFWSFLLVVTVTAASSAAFTVFEGLGIEASICSIGTALICAIVAIIAVKTSLYNQCYLVMCCILSCFLTPILFLFCGGITCGMTLYCLASIILISFASRGRLKTLAFIISMIVQIATIAATWIYPDMVIVTLDRDASYIDFLSSHIMVGLAIFSIGSLSVRAYSQEREKTAKLLAKLDFLSMHDSLTELYNRRYLLNYLENFVWMRRGAFYLAMLDIDNFKQINLNYGHHFGDEVICTVGKALQKYEDEIAGECTARYGCEKFIYVISAGSEVEAFAKVENFRKAVRQITFEKHPQVSLTISGGFVPCNSRFFNDVKQMLAKVDELLAHAKQQGKNQIRNMADN